MNCKAKKVQPTYIKDTTSRLLFSEYFIKACYTRGLSERESRTEKEEKEEEEEQAK